MVDGNRRFTCLRRIQAETNIEQFFEAIILDYDYSVDYKEIKSLELELQMGVDEKQPYNPIDRLFGVYKSIRIENAFTIDEYAALFDDYPPSKVKSDLALADLMCEYLEFQGSPGKYYIAKDMDLEGTGVECTLKVSEDGTADMLATSKNNSDSSRVVGPWAVVEGGMSFTDSSDKTIICPLEDGILSIDLGGGIIIYFTKDDPEAAGK